MSRPAARTRSTALAVSKPATRALGRALAVVGFTLLTAAAAQVRIAVPGTVVPMTLQTAVVLLAGLSLGRRDGAASQLAYLLGGAAGLPFFAAIGGSLLLGPTFGYLVGFVLAAAFAGSFEARGSFVRAWLIAFAASLLVFVPGVLQLKFFTMVSWQAALAMGVAPFLVGDLMKVSLAATAYALGYRLMR